MKKYGVYAHLKESKMAPWFIREYDTLKDAVREAYRLARCYYRNTRYSDEFIVGNNTGITLNPLAFNECIRYSIDQCIIRDDVYKSMHVYWGNEIKHAFLIKRAYYER